MPSLTSLTKSILNTVSQQSNDAYLIELDSFGASKVFTEFQGGSAAAEEGFDKTGIFTFQYFPESISDNKAINYQSKEIPGASLPLYQWIAGGERVITFTAMFTTDVDLLTENSPSGIAARISGASGQIKERLNNAGVSRRNVDIRGAVGNLRKFMYPTYQPENVASGTPLTVAPPKLRLVLPGSGLGIAGASDASPDSVRCIMTQCDVTWDAYFPSGLPRIATVSLAFAETPQFGGYIKFPDRRDISKRMTGAKVDYAFTPRIKGFGGTGTGQGQGGTGNF